MNSPIVEIDFTDWRQARSQPDWTAAVEAGKVLHFPRLGFDLQPAETALLREDMLKPGTRNVSLGADGVLKGAAGSAAEQQALGAMVGRFRRQALQLIDGLLPEYRGQLRVAPTSFRPKQVETRAQSVRADDQRMHVDAFPSRPSYGERLLRVFTNLNPHGVPRVWRVGEDFETVARRFLPRAKPYRLWQAKVLNAVHATKSLRSEYDHLMLQLHDLMKFDEDYQKNGTQLTMPFAPGSVWVCFSDQATHAVMSGQYMMEQTLYLPPGREVNPQSSPLAILTRLVGRPLVGVGTGVAR
ncbi:Kdo hydroxylase family protein [Ottowia sp.]|uniref:Kdo hydroxylase family protein n=1 Tax=Ottowia sp. TaxID=1898956 RepID=UPI002B68D87E|nr:Kdo hydroxylase family protein [Ottowia sp.]HOB67332.1 Kdo hydroxylase family protein [Ottowia sp.]HPZ58724.1 Kdo hydroxylase family protein [Ottowia sp.]HQD47044.1 Kdo hydroxylase family protein [Ottowia sp.]